MQCSMADYGVAYYITSDHIIAYHAIAWHSIVLTQHSMGVHLA